jgi:hypothetical protein
MTMAAPASWKRAGVGVSVSVHAAVATDQAVADD